MSAGDFKQATWFSLRVLKETKRVSSLAVRVSGGIQRGTACCMYAAPTPINPDTPRLSQGGTMQQVRLWEITADRKLSEISPRFASLEKWMEDWLVDDISVLDPGLLVIGRQVRTNFGGAIDLLCMDAEGNLVVVELKRGQTSRDVTSQALEYSSWVKDVGFDEVTSIADSYLGGSGSLKTAFREKFEGELPDQLNQGHRSLIVAESVDAGTDRIVRYLTEMQVPINVATLQHFEDANGKELLAQVYLIEPEEVQPRARRTSARSGYRTVNELQALADEKGIGEIYRRLRDGVRGIFSARGYRKTVAYVRRLENGRERTMVLVEAVPGDDAGGVRFVAHASRFEQYMDVQMDDLQSWLPDSTEECDVKGWTGSSAEERESAQGLEGIFHRAEEVDDFLSGLSGVLDGRS